MEWKLRAFNAEVLNVSIYQSELTCNHQPHTNESIKSFVVCSNKTSYENYLGSFFERILVKITTKHCRIYFSGDS